MSDTMEVISLPSEVFHWNGTRDQDEYWIDVDALRRAIIKGKIQFERVLLEMNEQQYQIVLNNNGVEESRIKNYPAERLETPIVICLTRDGDGIFVDGNHRYCVRWRNGCRTTKAFIVPFAEWTKHTFEPHPLLRMLWDTEGSA